MKRYLPLLILCLLVGTTGLAQEEEQRAEKVYLKSDKKAKQPVFLIQDGIHQIEIKKRTKDLFKDMQADEIESMYVYKGKVADDLGYGETGMIRLILKPSELSLCDRLPSMGIKAKDCEASLVVME